MTTNQARNTGTIHKVFSSMFDMNQAAVNVLRGFTNRELESEYVRYNFSRFKLFSQLVWPVILLICVLTQLIWWTLYSKQNLADAPVYVASQIIVAIVIFLSVLILSNRYLSPNYDIMAATVLPVVQIALINSFLASPDYVIGYTITNMHLIYLGAIIFVRMRFRWLMPSMIACWLMGLAIMIGFGPSQKMMGYMYANVFFGLILLWASYAFERYARYAFLQKNYFQEVQEQIISLEDEVKNLRAQDPETRLLTANYMLRKMQKEIELAKTNQYSLWLITVDIDYFGFYCENNTSTVINNCTYKVSECIKQSVQPLQKRTLMGHATQPGVFHVMIMQASQNEVAQTADSILNLIHGSNIPHRQSLVASHVSVSIGISALDPKLDQLDDLLNKSKQGVVQSMQEGRRCYNIYQPHYHSQQLGAYDD